MKGMNFPKLRKEAYWPHNGTMIALSKMSDNHIKSAMGFLGKNPKITPANQSSTYWIILFNCELRYRSHMAKQFMKLIDETFPNLGIQKAVNKALKETHVAK